MILVLNCFTNLQLAATFNRRMDEIISPSGESIFFLQANYQKSIDTETYSKLIISGSEESTLSELPWFAYAEAIIKEFIDADKPVLGICFGHQFLIRILKGRYALRKMVIPEFGWRNISLRSNKLFHGVRQSTFMVSHYDEVCNVGNDFDIIASSRACDIHAWQHKTKPVWGVQFHPEYTNNEAAEVYSILASNDPKFGSTYRDDFPFESIELTQSKILINFVNL